MFLQLLSGSHWTYRPGVSLSILGTACSAGFLKQCIRSILPAFNVLVSTPTTYSARDPCGCSPPSAIQANMEWSVKSRVRFFFCTVYVLKLSQVVEGQLWAWCAELHPVVAELGVNGSQSNRASLWCFAVDSRAPSLSRSSSAGCTACAGHQPRCQQQQTNLRGNYRQKLSHRCGTISQTLQRHVN